MKKVFLLVCLSGSIFAQKKIEYDIEEKYSEEKLVFEKKAISNLRYQKMTNWLLNTFHTESDISVLSKDNSFN